MQGKIEHLFHYPVKGLSAQGLPTVALAKGEGFPCDRMFGFARPGSGFDPQNPKPLPKTRFVVLARDAQLALLDTRYDTATGQLLISDGDRSKSFSIEHEQGRADASDFLSDVLELPDDARPTLYSAQPHRFTDVSVVSTALMNAVSLINLDSVAAFSEKIGHPVDPTRFRGNIHLSGLPAFSELDLIDRTLKIGDVALKVVKRTKRCPATEVNLQTAQRDLDVPKLLRDLYGHSDMGVYAEVIRGGTLAPGAPLTVV